MAGRGVRLATQATDNRCKAGHAPQTAATAGKKLQKPPVVTFIETEVLRWTLQAS